DDRRLANFALMSGREGERAARAWRNELVHARALQGEQAKPERPVPEVVPELAGLERVAPPSEWPESRDAKRVIQAATKKRELSAIVLAADIRHSTDLMSEAVNNYKHAE